MSIQSDQPGSFGAALDIVGLLSADDQLALVDIVKHRLAEQSRRQIAADIQEARRDFAEGRCVPVTVQQLKDEILS
jgi:hypothetical protein